MAKVTRPIVDWDVVKYERYDDLILLDYKGNYVGNVTLHRLEEIVSEVRDMIHNDLKERNNG